MKVQDDSSLQYTNVEYNSSSSRSRQGSGLKWQDRQNKSNNNASTSSKVVLSFNDDQDDTKSYENVVLLSKETFK